ncbi:MAG TPA: tetrathionate reductase subunit TtrA [Betaproteobacteria bacterium]|nr:tetrathionate reductase subunit TtrA [Betaproteobacteria bacterium]
MTTSRRNFLKGVAAAGGATAFAVGYAHTGEKMVTGLVKGTSGEKTDSAIYGMAPKPEYALDPKTGKLTLNPDQQVSFTMCLGCNTMCGVRVRYDKTSGRILRVAGNPYHPLSSDPNIPYETPIMEAFTALTSHDESGLAGRSTACGRGNAVLQEITSPYRILSPLKRVGPRGSGKWAPISLDKLVAEVVEGGDLFGEGHVEGLRAIRNLKQPLDPKNPEYGPKANQLAVIESGGSGRGDFIKRFTFNSFGTRNYGSHGSYCGFAMRAGSGAALGDLRKYAHGKPDFSNCEFGIFIGSAPGNAGKPFKRQGRLIAEARTDGKMDYVVVDPALNNSSNMAAMDRNRWVPIIPGTDGAFAMAMTRWILENQRYDAKFLSQPGPRAAATAGEGEWSNASHLVIVQEGHARSGHFLRASDMGWSVEKPAIPIGKENPAKAKARKAHEAEEGVLNHFVVFDAASGKPQAHVVDAPAALFYSGVIDTPNGPVMVKTSLQMLKEAAEQQTMEEYATICGIPQETIEKLAYKFTSHGKKAAVDTHGGMMATNGFYSAFAVLTLNTLIGNYNWKGGMSAGGGHFPAAAPGPRYNLKKFKGMVKPRGVFISRSRFPYHKTSEFKRRKAAGQSPYPTRAPWYPFSPPLLTEFLTSHFNGYPYKLKALIAFRANPLYAHSGSRQAVEEKLKDPKDLPLYVAVDGFITETNTYADYIVPDSVMYESWGWIGIWSGYLTKASTARWPVLEPAQNKYNGEPITLELFLIEVAKKMGLPGFGEHAISDHHGNTYPLNRAEDYYLRAAANVAFAGKPVPNISDEEIKVSGVSRIMPAITKTLKPEEARKVAYVYARGGRFENASQAYVGDRLKHAYKKSHFNIYNEKVGVSKSTITGKRFSGTPVYMPQVFVDGTPMEEVYPRAQWPFSAISYKSNLQSSYSIINSRLTQVHGYNPVGINAGDANRFNIRTGDLIRVSTPGGSLVATALVRHGVAPGVLTFEYGFGHTELGARPQQIGDKLQPSSDGLLGAGVNINDLGLADPRLKGVSTLGDWVVGSAARTALPAKIEKI